MISYFLQPHFVRPCYLRIDICELVTHEHLEECFCIVGICFFQLRLQLIRVKSTGQHWVSFLSDFNLTELEHTIHEISTFKN